MDRIFKISQGIKINVRDSGKKGAYELGHVIEFKTSGGEYQERFYPDLTLEEAINQVLKSNGVDISEEDMLESLLESKVKSQEELEKLLESFNKNEV